MSYAQLKAQNIEARLGGTRDQHLLAAMERALRYVEHGDPRQGFTSMLSDLSKHPELEKHKGGELGVSLMLLRGWIDDAHQVRHWIEGFN